MNNDKLLLYTRDIGTPGIQVIVSHMTQIFSKNGKELFITHTIDDEHALYVPYGPLETYELIKYGRRIAFSLMVDYYSLGCKNSAIELLKEGKIATRCYLRNLMRYIIYNFFKEPRIYKEEFPFIFVSQNDIEKLKDKYPNVKCICVPNGVSIPEREPKKTKSDCIRLGILSNWVDETLEECRWFIENYLPKIVVEIPNLKLVIAGKCINNKIESYFKNNPHIEYLGWVDSLDSFFNNIDIYVATVPRGCGILNKLLDAFAHRTPCIGNYNSISGFKGIDDGYIVCRTANDYIGAIKKINSDNSFKEKMINKATQYIVIHNNWDRNYDYFYKEIMKYEKD